MQSKDPFGFDMSAASDKKRRSKGRRGMSGAFETSTRGCDHAGCKEPGQYRAPKSPRALDDYYWFCKEHVREYNLNWNYFQGQSEEEFQRFLDSPHRVIIEFVPDYSLSFDGALMWARSPEVRGPGSA
jgi:hypothetical protein